MQLTYKGPYQAASITIPGHGVWQVTFNTRRCYARATSDGYGFIIAGAGPTGVEPTSREQLLRMVTQAVLAYVAEDY